MNAPRWVFAHGFSQTHHSWWPTIAELRRHDRSRAAPFDSSFCLPDLPGHGVSQLEPQTAEHGLDAVAQQLARLGGRGVYVGYSFGGRVVLNAAVLDAQQVERQITGLVLISTSPGIEDPHAREPRSAADDRIADRIEELGTNAFLDEWLTLELFGGVVPSDRPDRERNTPDGLAASLRYHGTGRMRALWDRLSTIDVPTLIVTGSRDAKFTQIGAQMCSAIPSAMLAEVGAAHSIPIEAPKQLAECIARWTDIHRPILMGEI